ncbi:hypothetical protein [Chryseobacterium sp. EO14]|uniref:hypothetical protein n=1 Tax=Chryseobacterium sp. EO14 TaxID=2950551 RepID=UPI00210BD126|nr:hypothetical protein [Chryseobacterium sp. EO14]MCQ4142691.1 hypothetical protein [Chryseobacterium sp. EO14]
MLDKEIIDREIRYIAVNDVLYFDVRDIKEKTTNLLVRGTRVKNIDGVPYILAKDIRLKTEVDYLIEKTLNFNPDKED